MLQVPEKHKGFEQILAGQDLDTNVYDLVEELRKPRVSGSKPSGGLCACLLAVLLACTGNHMLHEQFQQGLQLD